MASKVRFGFIGCGNNARYHADVIKALGHDILAVSARPNSPNISLFYSRYGCVESYFDPKGVIENPNVDAIVLCVSWKAVQDLLYETVHSGKPVLAEKPVSLDSSRLKGIIECLGPLAKNCMVGYNRRFYDFIPELAEKIAMTPLLSVRLTLPETVSRLVEKYSISIREHMLTYMSSHWFDLIYYLLGDLKVRFVSKVLNKKFHAAGYHGILTAGKKETIVHYESDFDTPQLTELKFVFTDHVYRLSPLEKMTIYGGLECIEPTAQSPIRSYVPKKDRTIFTDSTFKPGYLNQMSHFIDCYVLHDEQCSIACSLEQALAVTQVCEDIKFRGALKQIRDLN